MSLVDDEVLYARETVNDAWPIMQAHFPGCGLESDFLDVLVTWHHDSSVSVTKKKAYEVAAELRGKLRGVHNVECDWHVRSLQPLRLHTEIKNHPHEGQRIGTRIWFSRGMEKPSGYDETDISGEFIKAPFIAGEEG